MTCFLLLAAVYSLIIHQWHKENVTPVVATQPEKVVTRPAPAKNNSPVSFTANTQFVVLQALLKMNK